MIEFKTSKGEFVVVDYSSWSSLIIDCNFYKLKLGVNIFRANSMTEEDAKLIVTAHESESINTHLMKLHSLLKSKGIDINNGNWYLFKKV